MITYKGPYFSRGKSSGVIQLSCMLSKMKHKVHMFEFHMCSSLMHSKMKYSF